MPSAKVAVACALSALLLSACGSETAPPQGRGKIDNPRTAYSNHIDCLHQAKLAVSSTTVEGLPGLQVGVAPSGPTIAFEPTPGQAQGVQITGKVQGAEVIGSALLYPNAASDAALKTVERCLAVGVKG